MRRREFITLTGAVAATWPLAARAQDAGRRIGVLMPYAAGERVAQARVAAFLQSLQQLGWADGRNLHVDIRWAGGNEDDVRKHAGELVASRPDVILANGSAAAGPVLQATHTIPVVFVIVPDPVGAGYVENLARPGRNATGFSMFEYGIAGKWLELLKQITPAVTRVAVLRDPAISAGIGLFGALQSIAPSFGVEAVPVSVEEPADIEHEITTFARSLNGGLIVTGSALAVRDRDLIITLAARYKLPAVYFVRLFVEAGGLMSYGPDFLDQFRRAAGYVDRILRGEKPADLPVQAPTKYEFVINLKTAKALGLSVPPALLATADEVIE
jgi:putative tryptophan/tyrosine transport system substrate-binding protein